MYTNIEEVDALLENEKLVYSIINRFSNHIVDREDLYQVGMMGLLKAKRNYQEDSTAKFSTYAYKYILGEVSEYLRKNRPLKVSKEILAMDRTIQKTKDSMTQTLGRPATDTEVALYLGIEEDVILEAKRATEYVQSLDYPICEDGKEINLYDSVSQEEMAYSPEMIDLKLQLEQLPEEERDLIMTRYFEGKTQQETSDLLGISQVQVSRKEAKVLQKLKNNLAA